MSQPRRAVPLPPKGSQIDSSSSEEETIGNNEGEKRRKSDNDEVFYPNVEVIKEEENTGHPVIPSKLRSRRVSYGKIPVPPMAVTVRDIQAAAKQSREERASFEIRKPVDPRRSSVSLDVFKGFRDPHDRRNMPAKDKTVYVEGEGKFREMKKGKFWGQENPEKKKERDKSKDKEDSVIPNLLRAPGQAYRSQRVYNQVASIVQGFLAGISVMLTIFSFNLAPDVLQSNYRIMSLPIHAAFLAAFSLGFVSAIDRTGIYELEHFTSKNRLLATIANNGLFTFVVWLVGLVASLLCIQFESQIAFEQDVHLSDTTVNQWRVFNCFRSVSAALGFLLLAFKPDSDTLAKELRKAISDQLDTITKDSDRRQMILGAMKI